MVNRGNKKSRRYWLSAKPPSRKKKYATRRAKRLQNEMANELPPANICLMDHQAPSTAILNGVNFPTTESAARDSEVAEATAAEECQQGLDGIAEKTVANSMDNVQIKFFDDERDKTADVLDIHEEFLEAKREFEPPGTRHVVDFGYIFSEMHRKFANHNPVYQCTLDAVQLVSTLCIGLATRFGFRCSICLKEEYIMSEPEESSILSVNESAVVGAVSMGIGYSQARGMFNAINIPFMSRSTYQQYHDKITSGCENPVKEEMREPDE